MMLSTLTFGMSYSVCSVPCVRRGTHAEHLTRAPPLDRTMSITVCFNIDGRPTNALGPQWSVDHRTAMHGFLYKGM